MYYSTALKNSLDEIVRGHHNDATCQRYQTMYETTHGRAPESCKFKKHPKEIPKLLEKIIFENQNHSDAKSQPDDPLCENSSNPKVTDQAVQTEWPETHNPGFLKTLKNFFRRK